MAKNDDQTTTNHESHKDYEGNVFTSVYREFFDPLW